LIEYYYTLNKDLMKSLKLIINLININLKQQRRWFCFKINQNNFFLYYFLNILVLENYIKSYQLLYKNNKLWIEIILYSSVSNKNYKKINLLKKKEKLKINSLWFKHDYSNLLILTTPFGLLTRKDCMRLNIGGIPLINLKI